MESEGNIKNITIEEHLELVEKYFPTVNLKDPEHFYFLVSNYFEVKSKNPL